jgi:hypothetical protein
MNKITAFRGDIFCIRSIKYKKWCAYQVTHEYDDGVALLTLDWFSDQLLQVKDFLTIKPLLCIRFSHNNKIRHVKVPGKRIMVDFIYVGNCPPLISEDPIAYTGAWPIEFQAAEHEYIWKLYPKAETEKYKAAKSLNGEVIINGRTIGVQASRIVNKEMLSGIQDWKELDQLSCLTEISYWGTDKTVLEYIQTRRLIQSLGWWHHGQEVIDISATNLNELIIDTRGLKKVVLSDEIEVLSLSGENVRETTIVHPVKGRNLNLRLSLNKGELPDYNLPELKQLSLVDAMKVDIDVIAKYYPNLLHISISGHPGFINNIHDLNKLKKLRSIRIDEMYGYTSFPLLQELSGLYSLSLNGFPAEVGKKIKTAFKDLPDIQTSQPRNAKWLAANMNNPFRNWDKETSIPEKYRKAAFTAYKKAFTQIAQLNKPYNHGEISPILESFIKSFNAINKCYHFDTTEAEDINEAYISLLEENEVEVIGAHYELFDKLRDF